MEQAVKYTEALTKLTALLTPAGDPVTVMPGRRFDRITVGTSVRFFVDKNSWEIYGAKSYFQYNPRRLYGELSTCEQWDWTGYYPSPIPGTPAADAHAAREATIVENYRPRGRPRKNP